MSETLLNAAYSTSVSGLHAAGTAMQAMKQALEALSAMLTHMGMDEDEWNRPTFNQCRKAEAALRERLAQPEQEFTTHEEGEDGWSDWVCPDPQSYLMKCCDCGLVHEAQFGVVRYKSEAEREDCEKVDDPNLQAVFRMRRSEEWTPDDTAYRPGGLAQPEQYEQAVTDALVGGTGVVLGGERIDPASIYKQPEQEPVALETVYETIIQWDEGGGKRSRRELARRIVALYTTPPRREWVGLTQQDIDIAFDDTQEGGGFDDFARAIEAKLREKNA